MPTPLDLMDQAARELQPLLGELVFVGGATVGLLLTDPAAEEPRPTLDVDVATHVANRSAFQRLESQMRKLGFSPDPSGSICRYVKGDLQVDLMSDNAEIQGFTNPWYASAIQQAHDHTLPSGLKVRVMDAPHLIATKFVAWNSRGGGDMYHPDLEDILVVVDGRPELPDEVQVAPVELQSFVAAEFKVLLAHADFEDTVLGFCQTDGRKEIVLGRVRQMANL